MNHLNRKLGPAENLFEFLHDLGAMIGVIVARIEGTLTPDILQQALDLVQKRHPMLQVHIIQSADGFYFESKDTPKIPLRVIDKQHENQWIEIAQDELHQKFSDGTSPLCRVAFLRSSTSNDLSEIIATFHHAITDGRSCMPFFDDLLSYCEKIAAGDPIPEVATMQLLPPVENLLASSLARNNNLEEAQEKSSQEIQSPTLIIEGKAPASNRRTCLVPRILSQEMTIRLRERCKQEKTTVHGALCAAMLFGVANITSTDTPIHLSCSSNVSLRKYCEPEVKEDYMGCLASSIQAIHTWTPNTNFWDFARESKAKFTHSIRRRAHICQINSESSIQMIKEFIPPFLEQSMGRTNTINISNLGQFNILDNYGDFQFKEFYFATGTHVVGDNFWLGVVTLHEQLFFTFTHVVPLVSANTAELFADSVIDTIRKACYVPIF
ncbi:hypothetical protein H6F97_18335 [Microcoleus sp. FACHB-1]|nr:hypothetical protein [Microcoleus sp. FACHB-1]